MQWTESWTQEEIDARTWPPDRARPVAGQPKRWKAKCGCGAEYEQHALNPQWIEGLPASAGDVLRKVLGPKLRVPLLCPRCERRAVGHAPSWSDRKPAGYFMQHGSEGATSDAWLYGSKD